MYGMKTEDGWKEEKTWTEGRKKMDEVKRTVGQKDGWKEERWLEGRKKMDGKKKEDGWKEERRWME